MHNRSMPESTVIPVLPYPDVETAVAWLGAAFGFTPRLIIGGHRAQLRVGDGDLVIAVGASATGDGLATSVMVRVDDARDHRDRAISEGAVCGELEDHPFGERQYSAIDPFGHSWTFSQSIADIDPAEWGGIAP